jgi:hypothetical protein
VLSTLKARKNQTSAPEALEEISAGQLKGQLDLKEIPEVSRARGPAASSHLSHRPQGPTALGLQAGPRATAASRLKKTRSGRCLARATGLPQEATRPSAGAAADVGARSPPIPGSLGLQTRKPAAPSSKDPLAARRHHDPSTPETRLEMEAKAHEAAEEAGLIEGVALPMDNPGGRGAVRGRAGKVPIMNRIKKSDNPTMRDELSDQDDYDDNKRSLSEEEADHSFEGEEEYSDYDEDDAGSYENDDASIEYDDYSDRSDDRNSKPKQVSKHEGAIPSKEQPTKSIGSLLSRIKPALDTVNSSENPQKMVSTAKVMVKLPPPPPPPRIELPKERVRKAPVELPMLQALNSRVSERETGGTPHNKEVNSTLLAKVDRFADNDLMTRKYRLYLQKRKKKCIGGPRELMALANKFESLDLKNASCFAMCSQEEMVKRQQQRDIDLLERTDDPAEKKMRLDYAIKKFTRSSADQHLDKPEILRPPFILSKTLEHIMTRILDDDSKDVSQFPPPNDGRPRAEYLDIYLFVSDRLRSIKQDIQILSSHCPEIFGSKIVIQIYEQIVRFYILSCNELLDREGFDPKINLEQLSSAFTSLMHCYKYARQSLAAMYQKHKG